MTTSIVLGLVFAMYCMVRSWQCYRKAGETKESRVVSLVLSIAFGLIGTYMASCVWRELVEVLQL